MAIALPSADFIAESDGDALLSRSGLAATSTNGAGTSNIDSVSLPYQRWYRFKEAFAPSFVAEIMSEHPHRPTSCVDPFGGSGTTAMTCQALGIRPTTIEVNPFLADLIEAKLTKYDLTRVRQGWLSVLHYVNRHPAASIDRTLPPTFVEPGISGRWIFDRAVAERVGAYLGAIEQLDDVVLARLFRILIGASLVPSSNVVISGKGRRYRGLNTRVRPSSSSLDYLLDEGFQRIYSDLCRHQSRRTWDFRLLRGDARVRLADVEQTDVVLFSPPYPNSFDYTDIYNVELWMLGYLDGSYANRVLREATMRSHVQILRPFTTRGLSSISLDEACEELDRRRDQLWSRHIPAMLRAYVDDLASILEASHNRLAPSGRIVMVVGDSRYAGIRIDIPKIVGEIVASLGLRITRIVPVRAMRTSAQQGGDFALSESLVEMTSA